MAKNFTVKDDVQLIIYGEEFSFDSTDVELIAKMENFAITSQAKSEELTKGKKNVEALEDVIQFALDTIDNFLGEGASERIFKNTKVTLNRAIAIIDHIVEETNKSRNINFEKFSPQRAKRN